MKNPNGQILFDEYKTGFGEITKLIESFGEMSKASQDTFIDTRESIYKQQLTFIDFNKNKAFNEVKKAILTFNSQITTLNKMEELVISQMNECADLRIKIQPEPIEINEKKEGASQQTPKIVVNK